MISNDSMGWVRALRKHLRLTQAEMAVELRLSQSRLSEIETRDRPPLAVCERAWDRYRTDLVTLGYSFEDLVRPRSRRAS